MQATLDPIRNGLPIRYGWLLALMFVAVGGCKVGPEFHKPGAPVNHEWTHASHPRMQGEPASLEAWWIHFQDPVLQRLIHESATQNLTLREAGERILEARARRNVIAGNLFPQVQNANGAFTQSRLSSNTANFFSFPGVFAPDLNPPNWSVGLAAAWELDFWGKYRRAIESADASLNATCAAYDEARVLVLAEVAQSYIEMRTLEHRIALAQKNLEIQQQTLDLATRKKVAGLATGLDIAQAETNVGQTAAILPSLQISRRQANNALCVLLGRPPSDLAHEVGVTAMIPNPPQQLAFGIPADLLRRRPDVRRAEFEMAAQSARIGIAKSDFYPHISLIGNIGFASANFDKLFSSGSQAGLISPGFTWNLLNYGRIKNNVKAEEAALRALCLEYQNSVLRAAQEAEDAQVAFLLGFDKADALNRAVQGATDAVKKSESLYQAGSIDFGRVYVLQAELLLQQDKLAVTQGDIALSLVQLFKALGGGWGPSSDTVCEIVSSAEPMVTGPVDTVPTANPANPGPVIVLPQGSDWANVPFAPAN